MAATSEVEARPQVVPAHPTPTVLGLIELVGIEKSYRMCRLEYPGRSRSRTYFRKPNSEREIQREIDRLTEGGGAR